MDFGSRRSYQDLRQTRLFTGVTPLPGAFPGTSQTLGSDALVVIGIAR